MKILLYRLLFILIQNQITYDKNSLQKKVDELELQISNLQQQIELKNVFIFDYEYIYIKIERISRENDGNTK